MNRPLYELQQDVVNLIAADPDWLLRVAQTGARGGPMYELAAHAGRAYCPPYWVERWRRRWLNNWIRGFVGLGDPYHWKGGNFVAPLRDAWSRGRSEGLELRKVAASHRWKGA